MTAEAARTSGTSSLSLVIALLGGCAAAPAVSSASPSTPPLDPSPAELASPPATPAAAAAPEAPATGAEPGSEIRLSVGAPVRELLVPFDRDVYEGADVGQILTEVRRASMALCRYRHELAPLDRDAVARFVRTPDAFIGAGNREKWPLIAGCWNYVRMNDRHPTRDFELVRALYPGSAGYSCQAVGVLQPYLMSELLGCRSLTMLDFDWQIQAIHWQLLDAWLKGGLAPARLDDSLADLRIDWIAYHRPREGHEATIATICQTSMHTRCRQALEAFHGRREDPTLERVTLRLAGLHVLELPPAAADNPMPVIFLSNATEKHFLTREEFDELLARTSDGLLPGQRAIFIHHVATDTAFGIYELEKTSAGTTLTSRCRDEYVNNRGTNLERAYETWFEVEIRQRNRRAPTPVTCQVLARREQHRARKRGQDARGMAPI